MPPHLLWIISSLAEQDIQCEVLDLATIKPLDMESILTSVRKAASVVVVATTV